MITDQNRRWAFLLRVAGLHYRYYSGRIAPPTTVMPDHPLSSSYTDIQAITHIGDSRNTLDPLGGIAEHGPISITLASRLNAASSDGDPGEVFSRLGRKSASFWAQVTETFESDVALPASLKIDRDASGLSFPRVVHVGRESMWATAAAGASADPDDANPYRLTITARGIVDTAVRSHVARQDVQDLPLLTSAEVVFFRSRRAQLLAAPIQANGTLGDYVELMRGFIDSTPQRSSDGLGITIELVPLTALLDQELDFPQLVTETRLTEGYHYFEPNANSVFEVYQTLSTGFWDIPHDPRTEMQAGDAFIEAEADVVAAHQDAFDVTLPAGHPRAGGIYAPAGQGERYQVTGYTADGADDDQFDIAPNLLRGWPLARFRYADNGVESIPVEIKRAYLVDPNAAEGEILVWPGTGDVAADGAVEAGAFGVINAAFDEGSVSGEDGLWYGLTFDGNASTLAITRNIADRPDDNGRHLTIPIAFYQGLRVPGGEPPTLAEAWDAPNWGSVPELWETPVGGAAPERTEIESPVLSSLIYPLVFGATDRTAGNDAGSNIFSRIDVSQDRIFEITAYESWHSYGEKYLLVDDNIGTGPITIGFAGFGPSDAGFRRAQWRGTVEVVSVTEVQLPDGGPNPLGAAYLLELESPFALRERNVWPLYHFGTVASGVENVFEIRNGGLPELSGGALLSDLLTNRLGLTLNDVDIASLRRFDDPPWVSVWRPVGTQEGSELTYRDVVEGILRGTRTSLVMRTNAAGQCRLTRIPVSIQTATETALTIDAGDWAAGTVPAWGSDDAITNRVIIRAGYGENDSGEFATERTFANRAAQETQGEPRTEELDLYGLPSPPDPLDLLPLAQSIFTSFSEPRRTWTGTISTAKGLRAVLGAVASVSSPWLRAYNGLGVNGESGRIIEQTIRYWEEGCDLQLVHYGVLGTGWNAALRVASVVNATTITVDENAYSDLTHPVTGIAQYDLDAFSEGDEVYCEPYANQDGGSTVEISSINRQTQTIVFDGAHGLAVGDSVVPSTYDNAPAALQAHAYLADAAETLGASGDDGQVVS